MIMRENKMSTPKKIVTAWYKWDVNKSEFVFNHYSEEFIEKQTKPVPATKRQAKDWKKAVWRKRFGHLINTNGVKKLEEVSDI